MFYVANVITFSVFMEILQKSTLLISYKFNRIWTPWVNHLIFVHCYLLVIPGSHRQIKCSYMVSVNLPYGSSSTSQLYLILFPLCNVILFQYFKLSSQNSSNRFLQYMCFYYCFSDRNCIIYLNTDYWRKHLTKLSCDVSS